MSGHEEDLVRWRETSMDPSALPARAADLVEAAQAAPALSAEALARVHMNVAGGARASRLRGLPLGLRLATLAALLLASVATASGAVTLWRRYVAAPVVEELPTSVHHVRKTNAVAEVLTPGAAPVIEPLPEAVPEPATPEPRVHHAPARHAPVEVADPASEAKVLSDALAELRQAHDPRGALALLDEYTKAYPRGVLASEARSARLEAMLALDDRRGALALLDERTTFAGRLGAEQLLTRAELRASVGRYADAVADFDRALATIPGSTTTSPDAERALYGRAVTLGHLGRDDRARADLEAYRRRFPTGKHAAEVTRLLAGADHRP
ncbi:MAG TPA: tetratricopeptide repeat protein [Polyangia bacterium]|nr:tetratricopeptide repeat protein [Polyangia bacterium]